MNTPEILSKLTAKTARYEERVGGSPDLTWQDILLALQGINPGKYGFLMHVYANDGQARHDFFAGLFMEAMQHPGVRIWLEARQGKPIGRVERMCQLAVVEWKAGGPVTASSRAAFMQTSRGSWNRKYRDVYRTIYAIPASWEGEIMRKVQQRLT